VTFDHLDPPRLPDPTDADLASVKAAAAARRRRQWFATGGGGAVALVIVAALLVFGLGGSSNQAKVTSSGREKQSTSTTTAESTTTVSGSPPTTGRGSAGRRSSGPAPAAASPRGGNSSHDNDVLFLRGEGLWMMNSDGSNQRLLQRAHKSSDSGFTMAVSGAGWSPDRARVAVSALYKYGGEVYTMNASGDDVRVISAGYSFPPKYSPDGRQLALLQQPAEMSPTDDSQRGLVVMNVDGTNAHMLVQGYRDKLLPTSGPTWTRDGARLIFTAQDMSSTATTTTTTPPKGRPVHLYSIANDGTDLRQLPLSGDMWGPTISLDGTKLAFVGSPDDGPYGLYVANPDGSNRRLLVEERVFGVTWSPDNTQLIFDSGPLADCTCGRPLYRINDDGSARIRLTSPPPDQTDNAPAWAT
jgi:hypothetical protein